MDEFWGAMILLETKKATFDWSGRLIVKRD